MANPPTQHPLIDELKKITLPWAQFFSNQDIQSFGTVTTSNTSALTVTGITGHSTYLFLVNLVPQAGGGADIYMNVSQDNGKSFISTGNYEWSALSWFGGSAFSPTGVSEGAGGDTKIKVALGVGENIGFGGQMWTTTPMDTSSAKKGFQWAGTKENTSFNTFKADGFGTYFTGSAAVNALQFTCSTGNISGSVTCIGLF